MILLYVIVYTVLWFSGVPWWVSALAGFGVVWCAMKAGVVAGPFTPTALNQTDRRDTLPILEKDNGPLKDHERGTLTEDRPRVNGAGVRIAVEALDVTGALPDAHALAAMTEALPHLHRAVTRCIAEGELVRGTIVMTFRTEPNGLIRTITLNKGQLTGRNAQQVVKDFTASTMGGAWQFPAAAGPSLVEARFTVET